MTGADLSPEQVKAFMDKVNGTEEVKVNVDGAEVLKNVESELRDIVENSAKELTQTFVTVHKNLPWVDRRGTEEYTQEVLSWLNPEKEVIKGLPTTRGLRRFLKTNPDYKILHYAGEAVYNVAGAGDTVQTALRGSVNRFTIQVRLPNGDVETWGGIGEAFPDNIENMNIRKFPCSTAETRAEGRALTKLLGLNVLVLEELGSEADAEDFAKEDQLPAVDVQWTKFDRMFQMHDINARLFFNKFGKEVRMERISAMNKRQARELLFKLNTYQQGSAIPDGISGYDKKWLKELKEASK